MDLCICRVVARAAPLQNDRGKNNSLRSPRLKEERLDLSECTLIVDMSMSSCTPELCLGRHRAALLVPVLSPARGKRPGGGGASHAG